MSRVSSDFIKFQFTSEKTIYKDQRAFEKFAVILFWVEIQLLAAVILRVNYFFTLREKLKWNLFVD